MPVSGLKHIEDELNYNRRFQFICGLVVGLMGVVSFFVTRAYYLHDLSQFVQGICLIVFLFGLYAVVHAWRILDPDKHDLIRMLRDRPKDIVWTYSYVAVNMPYGVRLFRLATIYVNDRYGKAESIMVRSSKLPTIRECLASDLPWACTGYSIQKEQLYRANPELLYQD